MNKPYVSVIIPSFNSEDMISQCLEKILDQSYPKERYEVIVVDNASTDNSPAIIKTFPVKYLYEPQKGPSAARNAGISQAKGEYLLFIDSDCLAEKDLIENHILAHIRWKEKDPAVKVVGGGIRGINKNYWAMCDNFCSWYQNHPGLAPRLEDGHLPTANLSVDRGIFKEAGFFDETLLYGEDLMFCRKVIQRGYKIFFEPKAVIAHINRTSFRNFMKHAKEWAQIGKYTEPDNHKKMYLTIKNPALMVLYKTFYYFRQFFIIFYELIASWFPKDGFALVLCLPMIFINRVYFGYHIIKSRSSKTNFVVPKRSAEKTGNLSPV